MREGGDLGMPRAIAMYGGWCANELKDVVKEVVRRLVEVS